MTTTSIRIRCADKYEALKLASMALVHRSSRTYIAAVLDIIDNEVIVSLRDKSAHCIVTYDAREAESLAGYLQSILEGADRVDAAEAELDIVSMAKSGI